MGGALSYVLRRHVFLLAGILTMGLFFLVAGLNNTGALAAVMRVLIVPMYLVWLLLTVVLVAIFGPGGMPQPFAEVMSVISFAAGLAPYVLADYLLNRRRRPTGE
jgi:peptidoglycan/LPS O-acetylase OafA/YrhL